jgi:hypothetical protein
MSSLASVFMGVPQSRYSAIAVLLSMAIVGLMVIFGNDGIPSSQKFMMVVLVFLISLPSLALSLFQLTCIVTGAGFKNQRWWCSGYAWLLSAFIIFYSVLLVVSAVMSMTSKEGFEDAAMKAKAQDAAKKAGVPGVPGVEAFKASNKPGSEEVETKNKLEHFKTHDKEHTQ